MLVIDFSQIAIATITAELRGKDDVEISTDLVRHMLINAVRSYKVRFGKDYGEVVIAVDSRNYWRKRAFRYYKAGRKKARQASTIDWNGIHEAINVLKQELTQYFPYPVIDVNGAEADDVIATLAKWSQTNDLKEGLLGEEPRPFLVISGDHDFQQLQKYANVSQYVPLLKKIVAVAHPEQVLIQHIIEGDDGDGVPNFLSDDDVFVDDAKRQYPIFSKKVQEWIHWSFEDIAKGGFVQLNSSYERAKKTALKDNKPAPKEPPTVEQLLENLHRNKELVDLSCIPQELQDEIAQQYEQQRGNTDRSQILGYMKKMGLVHLLENIMEF